MKTEPNPIHAAHTPTQLIKAAAQMDWQQVVLNGGPPCFHLDTEDGRFCGRAQRWDGHDKIHTFVDLSDLLARLAAVNGELVAVLEAIAQRANGVSYGMAAEIQKVARAASAKATGGAQ